MKERLALIGRLALYWIIFFICCRALFLIYHVNQTQLLTFRDIMTVFFLGLRMDLAMTGYWLLLPCLLLAVPALNPRILYYVFNTVNVALLFISSALTLIDLELYAHWGFRMNTTPLFYIGTESAGSVNPRTLVLLIALFLILFVAFLFLYWKWLTVKAAALTRIGIRQAGLLLLLTCLLIIPIRSSFSVAPLNSGVVYFHKTLAFPNHAGINVTWNFLNSWLAQDEASYPAHFYDKADASAVVAEMMRRHSPPINVLSVPKPNIVLIVMESFTAGIIEPLGGMKGVAPNLNALTKEGILFDHFYASGDRTDKGLVSILSGFPAQPQTSIIKFPEKTQRLPFLSRALRRAGYHTSFVYGGDIGFANMESYLHTAGFSHITEDDDFDGIDFSKWGVNDHVVFNRLRSECDTATYPFFKVMLTLSSHEPFDVPSRSSFFGPDEKSLFLNACHYSDSCLGEFINKAKSAAWWKNTIIVLTADHGHHYPANAEELKEKDRFRIPLLLLGGALKFRDSVVHTLGGQTDIANTLLSQIASADPSFTFSKDLLDPDASPFAIYVFHNGYGFIDLHGETIYDFDYPGYVRQAGLPENEAVGKAYMQLLFDDFMKD